MCQNLVPAHRFCSYRSKIDDRRPTFPERKLISPLVGLSTVKCVAIRTFNVEPLRGSVGAVQRGGQVWGVAE